MPRIPATPATDPNSTSPVGAHAEEQPRVENVHPQHRREGTIAVSADVMCCLRVVGKDVVETEQARAETDEGQPVFASKAEAQASSFRAATPGEQ